LLGKLLLSVRAKKLFILGLFATLLLIAVYASFGPAEKSLGNHVRIVYVHGAWVWISLAAFVAAGLVGAAAFVRRNENYYAWSRALGITGVVFWVSYLPLSLWAMQVNWNGLFLAEPRWRMAVAFAGAGLGVQLGLSFIARPAWTGLTNFLFAVVLFFSLSQTSNILHPSSPILESALTAIQLYFGGMLVLTAIAAGLLTQLWLPPRC
jgi:hypothetical protein